MNDHVRPRRVHRGSFAVAAVLAGSGLLFVANAVAANGAGRRPQDLADLAQVQANRVASAATQVDQLRAQVDALSAKAADLPAVLGDSAGSQIASGSVAVTGPGLVVTLDDAPSDTLLRQNVSADVLVVHQQDLQGVIDALWAGGAEAVSLQDQRIISTSAVRCVGNVLRLHGRLYSPPYTVSAIGDPAAMRAALDQSPAVRAYQRDVLQVGLGWSLTSPDEVDIPAYSGSTDLKYAQVPPGVDPLTGSTPEPTP
jgi:uncharacterized protein YlxW (UPF0749 family)